MDWSRGPTHGMADRREFLTSALAGLAVCSYGSAPLLASPGDLRLPEDSTLFGRRGIDITSATPIAPKAMNEAVASILLKDNFPGHFALSFDDGPRPKLTARALRILKKIDMKATFFVCGRRVRRNREVIIRMVEEGHTIGNHTYSHPDLGKLKSYEIETEYRRTQDAVNEALGYEYPLIYHRPPYGSPWFSRGPSRAARIARQCQVIDKRSGVLVLWQIESGDWRQDYDAKKVIRRVLGLMRAGKGGIVVLHDSHTKGIEAIPRLAHAARKRGARFCTVDDLLRQKYACNVGTLVRLPTSLRGARG